MGVPVEPTSVPAGGTLTAEALVRVLRAATARICPRWLSSEREDLVQAALLRIVETLGARGDRLDVNATYAWKTAYSVTLDEVRRARHRHEQRLEGAAVQGRGTSRDPESLAVERETGRKVRECLAGLETVRRRAVQLRLAGFGHPEAARMLELSAKQFSNLVFRGMEDLRRCLRSKGVGP